MVNKKNTFIKALRISAVALGLLVVGVSVTKVSADGFIDIRERVVVSLAGYLDQHPDANVARMLALWLVPDQQDVAQGILLQQTDESPVNKVCYRDSDGARCIATGWEEITLPTTASTTVAEPNLTGTDVIVDYAETELKGTVSSTVNIYVGVTSSPYVAWDAASGKRPDSLMDGTSYATSTANIEYSRNYRNLRNSWEDQGTGGVQASRMASSSYFVVFLQTADTPCPSTQCEAVTSSNRGYTGTARYKYHYSKSL